MTMCSGGCNGSNLPSGPAGADGLNAFTTLTAGFTQPNVGANVTVSVSASGQSTAVWAVAGQVIYIAGGGYYEVVSRTTNTITVENLGYSGNALPLASVSSGGGVSPAGLVGPQGQSGTTTTTTITVDGPSLVYYDTVHANRTANTYGAVKTYAIAGGTLSGNGDVLRVEAVVVGEPDLVGSAPLTQFKFKVELDGQIVYDEFLTMMNAKGADQNACKVTLDIRRLSATTFDARCDSAETMYGYAFPSFGSSTYHILGTPKFRIDAFSPTVNTVSGFGSSMNLTLSTASQNSKNITVCAVKIIKYKKL